MSVEIRGYGNARIPHGGHDGEKATKKERISEFRR
jgi:hypothetical protein